MVRRLILITGNPQDKEDEKSYNTYLGLYRLYFKSNAGGAYDDNEILVYREPETSALKNMFLNLRADFAVIVLIGHGATKNENQVFSVNKNEKIKSGQLDFKIEKQLIIVESCRDINKKVSVINLTDKPPIFKDGGTIRSPISRSKSKELYNKKVLRCNKGLTICLACSKGESAWNYYFSNSLIQTGFNWHLSGQNHSHTLGIVSLMGLVKSNVQIKTKLEINEEQNPNIIGEEDFPFSVSKF